MASVNEQIRGLYGQIKCLKEEIKECCQNFIVPTGLEVLDDGVGQTWRLVGRDADFHINGGYNAIDFSYNYSLNTYGASGQASMAIGENVLSSSYASFTHGYLVSATNVYARAYQQQSTASGWGSVADGYLCISSASYAWTRGHDNQATKFGNVAWGDFNRALGFTDTWAIGKTVINNAAGSLAHGLALDIGDSWGVAAFGAANALFTGGGSGDRYREADPIMIVGNGTYTTPTGAPWVAQTRSNALFLDKGGRLFLPSISNAKIDAATGDIVITKDWFNANTGAGGQNNFVTAGSFNIATGDVTLTIPSQIDPVYNLDGRYLLISDVVTNTNDFLNQHLFSAGILTSKVLNRPDVIVDMNGHWLTAADLPVALDLQQVTDLGSTTDNGMSVISPLNNGLGVFDTVLNNYSLLYPDMVVTGDSLTDKAISLTKDYIRIQNTTMGWLNLTSPYVSETNREQQFQDADGIIALLSDIDNAVDTTYKKEAFTNVTEVIFVHNLNEEHPVLQVYDNGGELFIAYITESIDANTSKFTFSEITSGTVIATVGSGSVGTGGATMITQDEGVQVDATATTLNFVGPGVTATDQGAGVTQIEVLATSAFAEVTDYRSSYENNQYIYAGYLLDSVITITRTINHIVENAQSLTDLETDWTNRLTLTYI